MSKREPQGRHVTHACTFIFFFLFFKLKYFKKDPLSQISLSNTQHGASAQAAFTVRYTDVAVIVIQIVLFDVCIAVYPSRPIIILVQISFLIFEKSGSQGGFFCFCFFLKKKKSVLR